METFLTFFPFATRRRWQFSRQFPPCCSPSSAPMNLLLPSIDFCKLKHATLHCAPHSPRTACRCTFTALHLEGRVSEVRVFLPTLLLFVPLPFFFLLISCLSARLLHSPPSVRTLFCPSTEENGRATDERTDGDRSFTPQHVLRVCFKISYNNSDNVWEIRKSPRQKMT